MRGRVLVIDRRTPMPDQDSGSASTLSFLRVLVRAGFRVTFAPASLRRDGHYSDTLEALGITTLGAPSWPSLAAVVDAFAPESDVLLAYRAPVARRVVDRARQAAPGVRIVFHAVDMHFLRMEREAALRGSRVAARAARRMREIELDLFKKADAAIVVSDHERELLRALAPDANVHRIPILRPRPPREVDAPGFHERTGMVFIGGYEHVPNVEAVLWFCREVWPLLLRKSYPGTLTIAGSKMPDEVAALASDRIVARGHVPDLAALFNFHRMSIAPLRYGAGIKGKIVSSLSYGLPVVATSIAAEGMGLRHEHELLVADTPETIADQIMRLDTDRELWTRLARNGYEAFLATFCEDAGADRIVALFDDLVARKAQQQDSGTLQK